MPGVTVYTLPSCQPCRITKRWLDRRQISYTEIDISQNEDAEDYIRSLGYQQAPVITTSLGHWTGYRPDKLEALL